jgi:outer membrane biosynthesis protein TonB
MKFFPSLLGFAIAGLFGYMAEPGLRFQLTGQQPGAATTPAAAKPVAPAAEQAPSPAIIEQPQAAVSTPPTPQPTADPATPPSGDSEEPKPASEPPPMPEPKPEPASPAIPDSPPITAAPEAAPAPAEEPAAPATAGVEEIIKAMQASLKSGQIKEFTFEKVTDWQAQPAETLDGSSYQIGLASYKAETIFGEKTIQAKALIKGGKVQRWVYPKSGATIK